jgi:hypothetical protein
MVRHMMAAALAGAASLVLVTAGAVQAQPADRQTQCFFPNEWNGWKATPDAKAIYLRVGVSKIYRLDLADACEELQEPDAHLITKLRGSDSYCNALDFDLSVSEPHGIPTPCIVSKMTQLTPDEAAALPKNLRP